jgi:hypothetical protein
MKIAGSGAGSGYIGQRHGSTDLDPDLYQNVTDPQHCVILSIPIEMRSRSAYFELRSREENFE